MISTHFIIYISLFYPHNNLLSSIVYPILSIFKLLSFYSAQSYTQLKSYNNHNISYEDIQLYVLSMSKMYLLFVILQQMPYLKN